jgi:hypothetical protein
MCVSTYLLLLSFTFIQEQKPVNQLQKRVNDVTRLLFHVIRDDGHDDEDDDDDDNNNDNDNNNNNNNKVLYRLNNYNYGQKAKCRNLQAKA